MDKIDKIQYDRKTDKLTITYDQYLSDRHSHKTLELDRRDRLMLRDCLKEIMEKKYKNGDDKK